MNFETLQTSRLILRALTPELYKQIFAEYTRPEIMEFFGCTTEKEYQEELKKYQQGLSMYLKSLLLFQLIEKQSRKVIGWCGYHTWYINHNRAEIGYMLTNEESKDS